MLTVLRACCERVRVREIEKEVERKYLVSGPSSDHRVQGPDVTASGQKERLLRNVTLLPLYRLLFERRSWRDLSTDISLCP
jgi:hypothetical protein